MRIMLQDRAKYLLSDGREFIVLSTDFARNQYRITWTKPEHKHEDVDCDVLEGKNSPYPMLLETYDCDVAQRRKPLTSGEINCAYEQNVVDQIADAWEENEVTYIGGRAVLCLACEYVWTTHSTFDPGDHHWCNRCQRIRSCESWIFVYDLYDVGPNVYRRGYAAEGPATLGMPSGSTRFMRPICALELGHDGEHEDNITRDRWL